MCAKVSGGVVTASQRESVAREVLEAGCQGARVGQITALKPQNPGCSDDGAQVGIFAGAFHDPSPSGIAANVYHGSKGPVYAVCGCLERCCSGRGFNGLEVPTGRFGQGNRAEGSVSMDYIQAKNKGNSEAGFFDYYFLQGAYLVYA